MSAQTYHLVYVLLWQDINLPLVESQTFDQALNQVQVFGDHKPLSVSIWILTPARFFFDSKAKALVKRLKARTKGVDIRLLPEVNRLKNFPRDIFSRYHRKQLQGNVIFHFRGEGAVLHFAEKYLKQKYDHYIVDVRGFWPAEFLYQYGVEDTTNIPANLQAGYNLALEQLKQGLKLADGIVTVSDKLLSLLKPMLRQEIPTNVIPCSVNEINQGNRRTEIRQQFDIKENERIVVYSGSYAKYQHLEDLTIPFLLRLRKANKLNRIIFLTHHIEKIKAICEALSDSQDLIYHSAKQHEVGDYLSACDLGVLLRKETLVNQVAQPVKVGEYLSAGVAVCVEGEVGGVSKELAAWGAGISVGISTKPPEAWDEEINKVEEFLRLPGRRENSRNLAREHFLWSGNVPKQRAFYKTVLKVCAE